MVVVWIILGIYVVYTIVMIPILYHTIADLKERQRNYQLTQPELYEKMSFQEQQGMFALQGSPLNFVAGMIANVIYKLKH
ncbi:MAG: DUF3949 domain-containing protein [Bacillaceae bacterium]